MQFDVLDRPDCYKCEIFKIQDGGQYKMAAAAILKNPKIPYFGRGLSDFDEIWHGDAR